MLKSSKPNKTPEDKRTKKEEKEEPTNPKDFDLRIFKSSISLFNYKFLNFSKKRRLNPFAYK